MFPAARISFVAGSALACIATAAAAQPSSVADELNAIRQQMQAMRQAYENQIKSLEARINSLEQRRPAAVATSAAGSGRVEGQGQSFQIGLSTSLAGGGSSVDGAALANLQRGDHDPNRNGFTLQTAELAIGGSVDPYFDAQANASLKISADGETALELEEAFFTTRSLPYGLQIKGGQYLTEFGRANTMHLHQTDFVDQPVITSRLLGPDGLRSQGARIAWLTPLPWFSELTLGLQNAKGEGAPSFLGEAGEDVGGHVLSDRNTRNFSDLLYTARLLNGLDLSETVSANFGLSGAVGPNATGQDTDTWIVGGDVFAKWQPLRTQRGFPFVAFHGEALYRRYEAGDETDASRETLDDWGMFAQGTWGFAPQWVAGLRLEFADGDGNNAADPLRDARWRLSPNVTWYPTEFSKVRLQYNRDWAQHLQGTDEDGTADTAWLQVEFSLGGHFAHTF